MQSRIGQYSIVRRLAVGGMAELFLARWQSIAEFEKLVALKRILPQHACSDDFVNMFLAEARLAAHLDHPNVVQVYDVGEYDGSYFFSMEYVHGRDLRRIQKECDRHGRSLPLEHAILIIMGVCAGLHHAHTRCGLDGAPLGIVHRDISPPNVLVTFEGGVKVVDFGIAKAATAQVLTAAGTLKGKIPYMSPEQCRCDTLDRRSDIFSIGILLWELTVGQRLYAGDNELAILQQISKRRPPKPSAVVPGYPRELEQIVMRALATSPDDRYHTAEQMLLELETFAFRHNVATSATRLGRFLSDLFAEARRRPTLPADVLGAAASVLAEMTGGESSAPSRPFDAAPTGTSPGRQDGAHAIDLATRASHGSMPSFGSSGSIPSFASHGAVSPHSPTLVGSAEQAGLSPTVRYDLDALEDDELVITAASRLHRATRTLVDTARRRPFAAAATTVATVALAVLATGWANAEKLTRDPEVLPATTVITPIQPAATTMPLLTSLSAMPTAAPPGSVPIAPPRTATTAANGPEPTPTVTDGQLSIEPTAKPKSSNKKRRRRTKSTSSKPKARKPPPPPPPSSKRRPPPPPPSSRD